MHSHDRQHVRVKEASTVVGLNPSLLVLAAAALRNHMKTIKGRESSVELAQGRGLLFRTLYKRSLPHLFMGMRACAAAAVARTASATTFKPLGCCVSLGRTGADQGQLLAQWVCILC